MGQDVKVEKLVSTRPYRGFSLAQVAPRPGSLAILENPSRYGNKLRYADGREVLLWVRDVQED
jgi:hypothetical protein